MSDSTQRTPGPRSTNDSGLFILAMDHRDSLAKKVYDSDDEPTPAQRELIQAGKQLVFDGLREASRQGVDGGRVGVLVDERYGANVARAARAAGLVLAMPIEASGHDWFSLEYGTLADQEWLGHIEEFDPDHVKVLVRDNPAFDQAHRVRQSENLARVSQALRAAGRSFLFELLVPPTEQQEAEAQDYDTDIRPDLTVQVIGDLQRSGVEPDIWKIEGLNSHDAAVSVVSAAQQGGRDAVRCVVLGRDAEQDELDRWLRLAAPVPGFEGFAIGRSIWQDPLAEQLAGRLSIDQVKAQIAQRFTHYARTYAAARG